MTPEADSGWPALPTETEIYILPSGEIVVADLPAELAAHISQWMQLPGTHPDATEMSHVDNQQHPTHST